MRYSWRSARLRTGSSSSMRKTVAGRMPPFAASVPQLTRGAAIVSASVDVYAREGDLAAPLERIALAHPEVEIGSYPFAREGRFGATLVVRGTDQAAVERVRDEIIKAMVALAGETAVSR